MSVLARVAANLEAYQKCHYIVSAVNEYFRPVSPLSSQQNIPVLREHLRAERLMFSDSWQITNIKERPLAQGRMTIHDELFSEGMAMRLDHGAKRPVATREKKLLNLKDLFARMAAHEEKPAVLTLGDVMPGQKDADQIMIVRRVATPCNPNYWRNIKPTL